MLKLAGIQFSCTSEKSRNLAKAIELVRFAAEREAHIACFPELCITSWFPSGKSDDAFNLAEAVPGITTEALGEVAAEVGMVIICPLFERDGEQYFNSAVVIGADGNIAGVYRKVHVPDIPLWQERYYFQPGDGGFPVFHVQTGGGEVCLAVQMSWDNFFPEGSRALALQGAQVIFAPSAAAYDSQPRWEKVLCANAIANGLFVFRVNRVGVEGVQEFYGKSFCADPDGELVVEPSGDYDGVILAEIDLSLIQEVRNEWRFFHDRRHEEYGLLSKINQPPGMDCDEN